MAAAKKVPVKIRQRKDGLYEWGLAEAGGHLVVVSTIGHLNRDEAIAHVTKIMARLGAPSTRWEIPDDGEG